MNGHPYEVLDKVESHSKPGKFYEIRKSHQDGKVYCTCPAWIFQARKGDGVCKHIAEWRRKNADKTIVVMTHSDYVEFKRALPTEALKRMKNTGVKRTLGEGL